MEVALILDENCLDFISHSEAQTRRLGARLGRLLQSGDIICLEGELGVGKTRFIQGVGRGMGMAEPLTSPTFTLVKEYRTADPFLTLYHIDLYRIEKPAETHTFGLEEYLYGEGVCLIEWAEKVKELLPAARLWITMRHLSESKRAILMQASGPRYKTLLQEFKRQAFGV